MSLPSDKYLQKIDKWLHQGTSLEGMSFTPEQRFRARLCYEAYQRWLQNKSVDRTTLFRNLARRDYEMIVKRAAEGDAEAQELVRCLHITVTDSGTIKERTPSEIANDRATFNHIVGVLSVSDKEIHKAMVFDNIEWSVREGKKQNDLKAVAKATDQLIQLYDGFKEEDDPQSQMPNANINITLDVTTVKRDRINLSEEEKARIRKQYGVTDKQYTDLVEQADGSWQIPEDDNDAEEEVDYIVQRDPSVQKKTLSPGMDDLL